MTELEKAREKQRLYVEITEKNVRAKNSLSKTKKSSFTEAISVFKLPFSKKWFVDMNEKSKMLAKTFIFSGVAAFIGLAMLFCAIIDLAVLAIYVAVFPFAWIFTALSKKQRIRKLTNIIDETEKQLQKIDIKKIENDVNKLEKKKYEGNSSKVEETEWYKAKCDEHYRKYMGLPPKKYKYGLSDEEIKKHSDVVENQ